MQKWNAKFDSIELRIFFGIKCTGNCRLLLSLLDSIDHDLHSLCSSGSCLFVKLIQWSPIIQWFLLSSPSLFTLRFSPSIFQSLFLLGIISIAPGIYVFFSSFVVNADKMKFRFKFSHVSTAQQQKRPWTHRWTDLFRRFFQICLLILSNKCVHILLLLCSLNANERVFLFEDFVGHLIVLWFDSPR